MENVLVNIGQNGHLNKHDRVSITVMRPLHLLYKKHEGNVVETTLANTSNHTLCVKKLWKTREVYVRLSSSV